MLKKIVLIGGGGHCKACIDVIELSGQFKIAGIIDKEEKIGQKILGYKILASDKDLPQVVKKYQHFLITMGSIKDPFKRIEKFEYLKKLGAKFPVIISPLAYVSESSHIDEGTIVMHGVIINSEAAVGKNCLINTKSLIEHEAKVGDHCHISTGSILNGKCCVGNRVFLGSNSVAAHDVNIADDVVIGVGSVVVKSITQSGVYVGNPARKVRSL